MNGKVIIIAFERSEHPLNEFSVVSAQSRLDHNIVHPSEESWIHHCTFDGDGLQELLHELNYSVQPAGHGNIIVCRVQLDWVYWRLLY